MYLIANRLQDEKRCTISSQSEEFKHTHAHRHTHLALDLRGSLGSLDFQDIFTQLHPFTHYLPLQVFLIFLLKTHTPDKQCEFNV